MDVVTLKHVRKTYGSGDNEVVALKDVSLTIKKGEFVVIVGFSGSGKTTLLNMIGGLDRPSEGEILISGKRLETMDEDEKLIFRRRNIGFIFQNFNLISILTAYENMILPIQADGNQVNEGYLEELVDHLGIADKLDSLPNAMSGGQQQRVAIARALMTRPDIVLADEPTGNLDSKSSLEVMNLLRRTSKRQNQTVVMITHNELLAQLADRIIRLEDGMIVG